MKFPNPHHIQAYTSGGGTTGPSATSIAASTRRPASAAASRSARAPPRWAARPPAGHRSSDAPRYRRPGRSDRPCGAGRLRGPRWPGRSPPPRPRRGPRSGPRQRLTDRGDREHGRGVVRDAWVPALRLDHPPEAIQRIARRDRGGRLRERLRRGRPPRALQRPRREEQRGLAQAAARLPGEHATVSAMSRALPTASPSGCDMSVTAALAERPQPAASARHALRQRPRVLRGLHERPGSRLHVEEDQVRLDRELLRHHAGGDQRDRRDRRRRVAQRVERAVGRHEVRRLRRDRAPHLLHLPTDVLRREIRPQPGDRLELVERPARVPESTTRELRDREPERRGELARTRA